MQQLKRFRQFVTEVWAELKKTTWPSQSEVYGTTLVVSVTVLPSVPRRAAETVTPSEMA